MTTSIPASAVLRPAVAIAGVASVAAGLVHLAAAANHEGDPALRWMFMLTALAQLGWGAAAVAAARPSRRVLLAGVVINGGAALVWALTRTVGISAIGALSEVETVGLQDLSDALFAVVGAAGALWVLVRPQAQRTLTLRWFGVMAAFALLGAVPALRADHVHVHAHGDHDHDEHEVASVDHAHDDGTNDGHDHSTGGSVDDHATHVEGSTIEGVSHDHAHGELASAPHDHVAPDASGEHEHVTTDPGAGDPHQHPTDPTDPVDPEAPHEHPTDPTDPTDPVDLGPITSIDDPRLTADQFNAAVDLIVTTAAGMSGFTTEEEVLAAGYESIGDGGAPGEYEHFVKWSYLVDAFEVDPAHIESIVMKINADGSKRVVSAMYILTLGSTMADAPDIAGELTTWHDHDNLCFDGTQLVAFATDGVCSDGVLVDTPPMLHVWVEPNPCGPFAGIDEHGVVCDTTHTH